MVKIRHPAGNPGWDTVLDDLDRVRSALLMAARSHALILYVLSLLQPLPCWGPGLGLGSGLLLCSSSWPLAHML